MLHRKSNVRFAGVQPELVVALLLATNVYTSFDEMCVLTSVVDGLHGKLSYHASGYALDLRLPHRHENVQEIATELRVRLGPEFDVVVESDHVHIEFDVRKQGSLK